MYLGHVVTRDGIHTDPEKVNAVSMWPVPTSHMQQKKVSNQLLIHN